MKTPTLILAFGFALLMMGCNNAIKLPIGEEVIVQFDRSSLGTGSNLPVSPTTEEINGAKTAIRGRLVSVDSNWIVVQRITPKQPGQTIESFWIPKDKVLLVERRIFQAQ